MTDDRDIAWFAVHTGPRLEWLAHGTLRQRGYETLFLHYLEPVRHARRTAVVRRSYFPRYLFVAVRASVGLYGVNHSPGVSTVVYFGDDAVEVPPGVIEELRSRGDNAGLMKLTPAERKERRRHEKGEIVRVNTGPFEGLVGAVSLDKGKQVRVWIDMFRGRRLVPFDAGDISPVRRSV